MLRPFQGRPRRGWTAILAAGLLPAAVAAATEDEGPPHWRVVASPYTQHFHYDPLHRPVWALGIERQEPGGLMLGATYFRNSFGQPSGYLYAGRRYERIWGLEPLFVQWSAGVLYGYKGPYKNKVPFNVDGFAPGLLVGSGWQITRRASVELHLLGVAGVMLQLGWELPQ